MEVKVEDIGTTKKKLTLEIETERVDRVIDAAYKKIGKKANLKGFRPGKVPKAVLEKVYVGQMTEEATRELVNQNYVRALLNQDFTAVGEPVIKDMGDLERGKPFTFALEVEIKPEIEAVGYTGLNLKKEKFQFSDQLVSEQLEEIRKDKAESRESEREVAEEGDQVVLDFEGFRDGEPIPHGKAEDYQIELGSHSLIPGFEDQVVGMRKGEEKEIEVAFPEGYVSQELAGQKAQFKVRLKSIKEKVLPLLDDEFAKKFGMETFAEFREKITTMYREHEEKRVMDDLKERIVTALIEKNPIEVPEVLVEEQLKALFDNFLKRLKEQGLSLEKIGMTIEEFREKNRPKAVRQVQAALILEAVTTQENIGPTAEEKEERIRRIAEEANAPLDKVKEYYEKDEHRKGLNTMILEEKVVDFILSRANVEEVDKADLANE
ncbi:MAG: trigger factor [Desulfuromonadaceae bacterium]|nr:trigger factor [Desulfuromonadaceae bacterium]